MIAIPFLYAALKTRVETIWPERTVYETEHVDLIAWTQLTVPYAVIAAGRMTVGNWGANNLVYESPLEIYTVRAVDGPSGGIVTDLETLRDSLWTGDEILTANDVFVAQILDVPELTWDTSLAPNQQFIEDGMFVRAGRLVAQCLIRVSE